jgi:hypothetical protein
MIQHNRRVLLSFYTLQFVDPVRRPHATNDACFAAYLTWRFLTERYLDRWVRFVCGQRMVDA